MKENLFAICLICIEIAFFYLLYYFVNLPLSLYIQLGVLWLIIMFVSKHYKIRSTLVWDEIRSDLKAFIYFVLIAFVFVYPKTYFYWKILGVGFFMSVFAIIFNRKLVIKNSSILLVFYLNALYHIFNFYGMKEIYFAHTKIRYSR